jgi:hypothetical protein
MTKRKRAKAHLAWAAFFYEDQPDIITMRWTRNGTRLAAAKYGMVPKRLARVKIVEV